LLPFAGASLRSWAAGILLEEVVEAALRMRPGGACDWWPAADDAVRGALAVVRNCRVWVNMQKGRRAGEPELRAKFADREPLEPSAEEVRAAAAAYRTLVACWQAGQFRVVAGRQRYEVTVEGERVSQEVDAVVVDLASGRRYHADYCWHDYARLADVPGGVAGLGEDSCPKRGRLLLRQPEVPHHKRADGQMVSARQAKVNTIQARGQACRRK
jgi:hypothetical protein